MNDLTARYPATVDCFELETQIQQLKNEYNHHITNLNAGTAASVKAVLTSKELLYFMKGCQKVVEAKIQADTREVYEKHAGTAQAQVTTTTNATRIKLFALVTTTFLIGAAIVIFKRK